MTRIEPRSGTVVSAIPVGNGPSAVAVGDGAVWVVNRHDGTVSRIDPATNAVSWTVRVGGDPSAMAAGDGAVWVAGGEDGTVARIDRPPAASRRIHIGSSPAALAVAGGSVWAAAVAAAGRAPRRDAARARRRPSDEALSIDWIEPDGYDWRASQLTSLAYDGLVGYRRVGGAAGARSSARWRPTRRRRAATAGPTSSRCGRGCASPTAGPSVRGRPRLAGALPRVTRRRSSRRTSSAIVGARAMHARPRAAISPGIETDARARTITIHLTRPMPTSCTS